MKSSKRKIEFLEGMRVFFDHSIKRRSFLYHVKVYKNRLSEIEFYLKKKPEDWGKYQSEYNELINTIFSEILIYEKKNINDKIENIERFKKFFIKNFRRYFIRGEFVKHSLYKPFGYAGDFLIIDKIYLNKPKTLGIDRLADNYYLMSSICIAVRNRCVDFQCFLKELIENKNNKSVKIMNFASGPCREIKQLLDNKAINTSNCFFDCYEFEDRAIEYSKKVLSEYNSQINFIKFNALEISKLVKKITVENDKYDVIYSTGLFDYFNYGVSLKIIQSLKKLLKVDGHLVISSVRDKYSNPSVVYMEWVGDWPLVYRSDWEFRKVFVDAGFAEDKLNSFYEQQGIFHYIKVKNNN